MNLLTDFLGIGDAIGQAFRTFFGLIAATIYSLIEYIYHVFELLARAEIISSDFIQQIYSKVGTILSLFMLFKLSFSLIQSLIDPNKLTDEKSGYGKIIFRSVIAIVLLGTTPAIFREAYNIQNLVVGSDESTNVLYKLVVGGTTNGSLSTIGRDLSSTLYFQFFTDNEEPKFEEGMTDTIYENDKEYDDRFKNNDFATLKEAVKNSNMSFYDTVDYLAIKDTTSNEYVIEVSWLALIASGIFVLYMIAIYCIQVAIRVVQLAYLQLIAPIPILSYISDPDGSFKKWYNQCFKTYLDLFIRLTVIYFSMSIISSILNELNNTPGILYESTGLGGESWITQALVVILIIIGLLLFAKKVPELLKDLFPGFGDGMFSFGLSAKKNLFEPLKSVGESLSHTPIGWGAKGLGFAWKKTGGKVVDNVKRNHGYRVENRKNRAEYKIQENEAKRAYDRYGTAFDAGDYLGAFSGNKEYADSYEQLKVAKSNVEKASKYGADSPEYLKALADEKKAQTRHDNNRKKYGDLARREDNLKLYNTMHPKKKIQPFQSNTPSQQRPISPVQNNNQNNSQSTTLSSNNQPYTSTYEGTPTGAPTAENSIFAEMSDNEWNEHVANDERNHGMAESVDPNKYFDDWSQAYADEYVEGTMTDERDAEYMNQKQEMETAYKSMGWKQDSDGKWSKPSGE